MSNSQSVSMPAAQSPLVEIDFSQITLPPSVLQIVEQPFLGYLNLRGAATNTVFLNAVESLVGVALPLQNNRFLSNNSCTALWHGPDEWLLVCEAGRQADVLQRLRTELAGQHCSVCDVSGGLTSLNISGSHAVELLKKGCPMDLHESVFGVGQCAQTLLAKASMSIYKVAQADQFKVIIRRSFADYLGNWLIDAAGEFRHL